MRAAFYINFLLPLAVSLCWLRAGTAPESVTGLNTTSNATTDEEKTTAQFLAAIVVNTAENATNATSLAQANQAVKAFIYKFIFANNLKVFTLHVY